MKKIKAIFTSDINLRISADTSTSAGTSTTASLSTSAGEFYPEWLKKWDKKTSDKGEKI